MAITGSSPMYKYGGRLDQDGVNLLSRSGRNGAPARTPAGTEAKQAQASRKVADSSLKNAATGNGNVSGLGSRVDAKA
ncbi:MAG: hypothetical protein RDV41_08525 [Planctomycetota bacterium]|nr:hypothetical protein [Planctomycetota bacterium]